jgi:glycosyltransferase involved in cell wall biosynthesis
MRILFLYDFPLWGSGSGRYVRHLIEELIKLNYKIGIVCPEERRFLEDKIKHYKVSLPQIPVFVAHPELKGAKRYSELSEREITEIYKSYLDTTIEAVANFQPDLIHCQHLSLISWVARYIKALKRIPYIITSHGSCLYHILADKRYLSLCGDALRGAKAITVVSGDIKSKILKIFGRELEKLIYIIPGGISPSSFPAEKDVSTLDEKYQIKDKKVVMFAGRLISHKGAKYLVKAAAQIKGEVFIIGEGPEKEHLKEYVQRKGLKNVHILGYLSPEELTDFYYRADVFVAPSVWDEPLGLTILEAMAAKTPVVATRKGGIPLLIKEGVNGFFVPAKNAKEIAIACNKLLEDDELRKKMGENARQIVLQKFTWKNTAQRFHRLYQRLFKNKKK